MSKKVYYSIIACIVASILVVLSVFVVQSNATKKSIDVSMIIKSRQTNFEFWQTVRKGAAEAAKEFGVNLTLDGPENEEDTQGQIDIVKREIERGPDVLVLAAVDQEALLPYAREAKEKGIKLVLVDSALSEHLESCFVGTDNIAAARYIGEKMAEDLGGKGDIAIISHQMTTTTAIERINGFKQAISRYPDINIVEMRDVGDSSERSRQNTLEVLGKYPELDGIYATNAISAEGVTAGIRQAGAAGKVAYFAFDFSAIQNEALEQGVVDGFAIQKPFNMGYMAVQAAVDVYNGTLRSGNIDTEFAYATKENMYEEEIQKLIYPFI